MPMSDIVDEMYRKKPFIKFSIYTQIQIEQLKMVSDEIREFWKETKLGALSLIRIGLTACFGYGCSGPMRSSVLWLNMSSVLQSRCANKVGGLKEELAISTDALRQAAVRQEERLQR